MSLRRDYAFACALMAAVPALAVPPPANSLMGIHWYGSTESIGVGQATDVEAMTGNRGIWVTEITHVDTAAAPAWDQPWFFVNHAQKVTTGKGHSIVFRVQPYWGCNVPHPDDPFSVADYAEAARSAAQTLASYVNVWQIGNEVNLNGENNRFNAGAGNYTGSPWQPTPEQYAATYVALRDAIHETDNLVAPAEHIVLMQPNSPGLAEAGVRYMDSNEFLYRMIAAVPDKSKIDGFGLHSYAQPGGSTFGAVGFMNALREQMMIIDSFGLGDRPIIVTEFNKHMPNANEANIAAKFIPAAYEMLHEWNTGFGDGFPGRPNPNIVAATWFVYPAGTWVDYSLGTWKTQIASTDPTLNPWYSFQKTINDFNYPAGDFGGGSSTPLSGGLLSGDFVTGGLTSPQWLDRYASGATLLETADGLRVRASASGGSGGVVTSRFPLSDYQLLAEFRIVDGAPFNAGLGESNIEVRLREGSRGYSLTFFTSGSAQNTNRIVLRRVNDWATTVGGLNFLVPGNGISNGDTFRVMARLEGNQLNLKVFENAGTQPILDQTITDSGQTVGYVRIGTYNLKEALVRAISLSALDSGDVDDDGILTPGDAQAAFNCFLQGRTCPGALLADYCFDANPGGDFKVTPGDAQAIFEAWLNVWPTCF